MLVRVADDGSGPVIDTIRFYVGTEEFDVEGDRPPIGNRSGEDIDEEEAMTVDEKLRGQKEILRPDQQTILNSHPLPAADLAPQSRSPMFFFS